MLNASVEVFVPCFSLRRILSHISAYYTDINDKFRKNYQTIEQNLHKYCHISDIFVRDSETFEVYTVDLFMKTKLAC